MENNINSICCDAKNYTSSNTTIIIFFNANYMGIAIYKISNVILTENEQMIFYRCICETCSMKSVKLFTYLYMSLK